MIYVYKTEQELGEVISLGKPEEVIDVFLASYLQGLEFDKWKADKDLEATEEVAVGQDEDGNDIIEARLINVYEPIDVSEQMAEWKLDNCQILREFEYLPIAEQLDMQYKDKINGTSLWEEHIQYVKNKWKKREQI